MSFEQWLKARGIDPVAIEDEGTKETLRKLYAEQKDLSDKASANDKAAGEAVRSQKERVSMILGAAQSAGATATAEVRSSLLGYATELVSDDTVSVVDAQRKISEKALSMVKDERAKLETAPIKRDFAAPKNDGTMSIDDVVSVFGQPRTDRSLYKAAAKSVVEHLSAGNNEVGDRVIEELRKGGNTGLLRVHQEEAGTPVVRTVTASSVNTAIQNIMTYLLNMNYDLNPPATDPLVTKVGSSFNEDTLPEVETENGVRKVREGEPYPVLGGTDRSVLTSYVKYGAAIAQTRENSVFDKLGRVSVHLTSIARQLRNARDAFRLARICDSTTVDGRYVARPGNNEGSAVFYTASVDARGNYNLKTSNGLTDETDIDNAYQVLEDMKLKDGSYVMPQVKYLLVDSSKKATAFKILNSVYAPSATTQFMVVNPFGPQGMLSEIPKVISHPLVGTYAGATTTWFIGDPARQFYEKVVWDVEVAPKITGGEMALRDIVNLWIGSFCIDVVALSNMFFLKNTA